MTRFALDALNALNTLNALNALRTSGTDRSFRSLRSDEFTVFQLALYVVDQFCSIRDNGRKRSHLGPGLDLVPFVIDGIVHNDDESGTCNQGIVCTIELDLAVYLTNHSGGLGSQFIADHAIIDGTVVKYDLSIRLLCGEHRIAVFRDVVWEAGINKCNVNFSSGVSSLDMNAHPGTGIVHIQRDPEFGIFHSPFPLV